MKPLEREVDYAIRRGIQARDGRSRPKPVRDRPLNRSWG